MKIDTTKTITSIFMTPTIGVPLNLLKSNGYIGGYSIDSLRETQYSDAVYVLFKPDNLDNFKTFLDKEYERTSLIIEDYDYADGYVIIVYSLNPLFKADFDLIKLGKYSKTSKEFQKLFPEHVYIQEEGLSVKEQSLQYKIFNKTNDLVQYWEEKIGSNLSSDQELWKIYDEEEETLKI